MLRNAALVFTTWGLAPYSARQGLRPAEVALYREATGGTSLVRRRERVCVRKGERSDGRRLHHIGAPAFDEEDEVGVEIAL